MHKYKIGDEVEVNVSEPSLANLNKGDRVQILSLVGTYSYIVEGPDKKQWAVMQDHLNPITTNFKIGDKLIGTDDNPYYYIEPGVVVTVLNIDSLNKHRLVVSTNSETFDVDSKFFRQFISDSSPLNPYPHCSHQFRPYVGLTESYQYCVQCDIKEYHQNAN